MAKAAGTSSLKLDASQRIVVLHGQERFLIEEYTRMFVAMLEEQFGGVEQFHFDGETVDPAAVLDELRSYGLMQRHKLVILDHADSFLAGGGRNAEEDGEDAAKKSRRPLVERYAEHPVADATLLMRADGWRPGKLDKLIQKVGSINPCEPLSEAKAAAWCIKRAAKRYEASMEPVAAQLLVERLGPQLLHLNTELMKLSAMAGPGKPITRQIVAESVGLSREEKAWEIQGAIITGDAAVMLRKLRELLEISRQDKVPISWAIVELMRKMHAASQLARRRVPPQGILAQAKLWSRDGSGERIIEVASRRPPEVFAQLLRAAIETDRHLKSGFGDPQRNLEGLLVRIADMISLVRRSAVTV